MAKIIEARDPRVTWVTMNWRAIISIGLIGLLVGVVTYALNLVLLNYVFEPIMCRESVMDARCGNKEGFASAVAIILGSMVGLVFLVRERVYRPLLVILAVGLSMWGVFSVVTAMPWLMATATIAIAFALSYMLFAWVVQPISLAVALALATVAVVAIRLVLTA